MGAVGAFAPVLLQERGHCPHTKYRCDILCVHNIKRERKKTRNK